MKTIAFHNLGCKVNSYELDVMQQIMVEKGYQVVPFDKKADIYVINTCTVTNIADRKSRQMLHRAKQKNPEAVVVAVGCYVQTDLEGVTKDPAIDLAIGNNRKKDIAQILEQYLQEREAHGAERSNPAPEPFEEEAACQGSWTVNAHKTLGGTTVIDIGSAGEYEEMTLKNTAEHTRAYIKIQDGCNQFCSYCAIPLARGRVRSRLPEDVLREVETMVTAGYREIVLTGIHVSSYGIDFAMKERKEVPAGGSAQKAAIPVDYRGQTKLFDLIEEIHKIPGLRRIRISSLEPRIVTPETAKRLAALPKVCPHFHLSLQSGCDATLKRMNRHYSTAQYLESVEALRRAYAPRVPAITTDVIVGFPGETEEEFKTTKAFLEQVQFYEMHVFKYSKRKDTRAAVMPGQVPDQVKAERSDEILSLEREQSLGFRKAHLGQTAEVLWEEEKEIGGKRYLLGHTMDYVKVAIRIPTGVSYMANADLKGEGWSAALGTNGFPLPGELTRVLLKELLTEEIVLGHETDLF